MIQGADRSWFVEAEWIQSLTEFLDIEFELRWKYKPRWKIFVNENLIY